MIKFFITCITIPLGLALLYIMLLNMEAVNFAFSPVHQAQSVPLSMLLLAGFAIGFLFGAVITGLSSIKKRRQDSHQIKQKEKLDKSFEKQEKTLIGFSD